MKKITLLLIVLIALFLFGCPDGLNADYEVSIILTLEMDDALSMSAFVVHVEDEAKTKFETIRGEWYQLISVTDTTQVVQYGFTGVVTNNNMKHNKITDVEDFTKGFDASVEIIGNPVVEARYLGD